MLLLAQVAGYSFIHIATIVVVVLAVIAVVYVATKAMGVPIPQWLIQIIVICVVAAVAILAIKFLAGL